MAAMLLTWMAAWSDKGCRNEVGNMEEKLYKLIFVFFKAGLL